MSAAILPNMSADEIGTEKSGAAGEVADSKKAVTSGKTFADVFEQVLSQPNRWLALLGFLSALCCLVIIVMFVFTRLFAVEPSEFQLGGTNTHILFAKKQGRGGDSEYVAIVNPQGWQTTAIPVNAGDHVSFIAGGKICLDLNEISEMVRLKRSYEDEWEKKEGIRENDPTDKRVPEDYFTEDEKKSLIASRRWVDPDGYDLDVFKPRFRGRRDRYLLPDKQAGGLVGGVSQESIEPERSDAFFIGRKAEYTATKDGTLWLTVNDVQYSDPNNKYLFYTDNIGSFWVRIVVKAR